jgi:hypothetical protein
LEDEMKVDVNFLRRRLQALRRSIEILEYSQLIFAKCENLDGGFMEIFERIEKSLGELRAIRTKIEGAISKLEAAS